MCVPKSNSYDRYAITCDVIAYHLVHFVSIWVINKCQSVIIVADRKHDSTYSPVAFRSVHTGIEPPFLLNNILCDHCLHDSGLYIQKISTTREMINYQKLNFLLFLTINSVTIGVQELNGTSQISLVTHDANGEMPEI